MTVSNGATLYQRQAQNAASAAKDYDKYEAVRAPKKPTFADISNSVPQSEATKHSEGYEKNLRTFQFTNSKNIETERSLHKQVKLQLQKDGYISKAAMMSQNYLTRSEKGHAMMGS